MASVRLGRVSLVLHSSQVLIQVYTDFARAHRLVFQAAAAPAAGCSPFIDVEIKIKVNRGLCFKLTCTHPNFADNHQRTSAHCHFICSFLTAHHRLTFYTINTRCSASAYDGDVGNWVYS